MAEEQKKPTMPDLDLAEMAEDTPEGDLDTLAEIEEAADTAAFEAEIEALKIERDDMRDKWMRALADAENSRKRSDRDRREAEQYGGSRLARDMLPVHDNLSRALEVATEEQREAAKALIEGVELTMREMLNVFQKHGIETIAPEIGDKFDPQLHEAMFEAPLPDTKAGDIIQVSDKGFLLHDRLLRPAKVGVSSNTAG